jgi:hypothetical protein
MKVKMKALAVAVALAATSGAASALDLGQFGNPGELMFSVWDNTVGNEASFTFGLNLDTVSFDGNETYSFENLFSNEVFTANFDAANFANISNWKWNVVGSKFIDSDDDVLFTSGFEVTSLLNDQVALGAFGALEYARVLNNVYGVNQDAYGTNGTTEFNRGFAGHISYGATVNGMPVDSSGFVGDELFFIFAENIFEESGYEINDARVSTFAGVWSLDENGTLTYSALGAPVPVPAAVWLLGSALVGLVGVARRREAQAEALTA